VVAQISAHACRVGQAAFFQDGRIPGIDLDEQLDLVFVEKIGILDLKSQFIRSHSRCGELFDHLGERGREGRCEQVRALVEKGTVDETLLDQTLEQDQPAVLVHEPWAVERGVDLLEEEMERLDLGLDKRGRTFLINEIEEQPAIHPLHAGRGDENQNIVIDKRRARPGRNNLFHEPVLFRPTRVSVWHNNAFHLVLIMPQVP
jgi:hypothetical protein